MSIVIGISITMAASAGCTQEKLLIGVIQMRNMWRLINADAMCLFGAVK